MPNEFAYEIVAGRDFIAQKAPIGSTNTYRLTLRTMGTSVFPALRDGLHSLFHPPKTNVPALDVLRSAAILLVFTGHYSGEFQPSAAVQHFPVFRWGWTGVDLFFVLSGLLIGSQLWKELDRTGRIRIGNFLLRRGLRIWPLYYSFVLFILVEYLFGKDITGFWYDLIFVSNFLPGQVAGGWSLSTEEQFYILTPLLLSLFAKKLSPQRLWFVPLLALVAVVSARGWVGAHSGLPEHELRLKLYYPIVTHADGLAVGVFIAWFSVFRKDQLRSKVFSAAAVASMLVCGLVLYKASQVVFNFTGLGLIYGSMELYGISALPLPRVLRWRGFYVVSRLSFGLYLNHFGMLALLHLNLAHWSKHSLSNFWAVYLLCLAVCLLVAMVTFLLIEWPFLRIRAQRVDRSRLGSSGQLPAKKLTPP
jgi:peptidoglycan/LPS O-acetylase OafA/YrhL